MNKCKAPKASQTTYSFLIVEKKLFTDLFSQQCKPVINDIVLPNFNYLTNEKIEHIHIENKDSGSDGIYGQMLLLGDDSVILPLGIIFTNILSTAIYPDMWKLGNVTPIFKKGDKLLIKLTKNYRLISLLTICGKNQLQSSHYSSPYYQQPIRVPTY